MNLFLSEHIFYLIFVFNWIEFLEMGNSIKKLFESLRTVRKTATIKLSPFFSSKKKDYKKVVLNHDGVSQKFQQVWIEWKGDFMQTKLMSEKSRENNQWKLE